MLNNILHRREWLQRAGQGCGMLALADLLAQDATAVPPLLNTEFRLPNSPAKSIIWLFMEGAPSAVDVFDPKPELDRRDGQRIDIDVFFGDPGPLMKSPFKFQQYG